jgi:hypothetical protein
MVACVLVPLHAAAQSLTIQLQAGAALPVTIQDNGPGDGDPTLGVVQFTGGVGSYTLNVVVGQSKPVLGGPMLANVDLFVFSLQGGGNDTLSIRLSDKDFPGPINTLVTIGSTVGGNTDSPSTTFFQSFLDASNQLFGTTGASVCTPGVQGVSGSPFSSTASADCPLNGPFSLTLEARTRLSPGQSFGFDFEVGVPLPQCGALGDFVWHDLNHNGIQDPGEPGINGVTLTLSEGGSTLATTTTGPHPIGGAAGYYQFNRVCAGTYEVDVDESTVPANFTPTLQDNGNDSTDNDSSGGPVTVTLPFDGASDQTIDFGFETPCTGSIGNFVWNDLDQDGIQDAGEPGIPGVTLQLMPGGQIAITDAVGFYQFTGLCAGTYEVSVTVPPPGLLASPALQGGDTTLDSNTNPTSTTLVGDNASDQTLDFGYYAECVGALGDFVWNDLDRDGVQDAGEPGIQGVKVILRDAVGNVITHTFTDANGFYLFGGLCGGDYRVEVDLASVPPGLSPSPVNTTAADKDSNPNPTLVTLPDNATDLTIDFGFMPPCAGMIGDFVWFDVNRNGIQDAGEPGIGGVQVELRLASDNSLLAVTTTDASGLYKFVGLCANAYKVVVMPPAGYAASPVQAGGDTAKDSNPNPALVVLTTDFTEDLTIDFGFTRGALGDFVWHDLNANGQQNAGEPGIANVSVTLLDCDGNTLATTTTNASGLYLFSNLLAGCYRVRFATPAGFTETVANSGNDATDSDASGGITGNYVLAAGTTNLTVDAGFYKPAALGDYVWKDLNQNGVQDAGEPGIAGSAVTLLSCANAPLSNMATNAAGFYLFSNLTPGCYRVQFATPAGLTPTLSNVGNDALDSDPVGGITGNYTLASGETNLTVDAGFFLNVPPPCIPTTFTLVGGTTTSNKKGNIRTFSANGINVHASAFSRADVGGAWSIAYLGAYSHGLGVTDTSESGSNDTHTADNMGGRDNYVLFEFSQPVAVTRAFLDYVGADSDITVWVGMKDNPYQNHLTLSDALLNSLTKEDNNTESADERWAQFNGPAIMGNVLVIAASTSDSTPEDSFKLKKLDVPCVPPPACPEGTFELTGNSSTSGSAGNIRTFSAGTVSMKASAFSRESSGAWATAYLGAFSSGLGVTDASENGSGDTHKVDNIGRRNYVLFEFSQLVTVNRAFLDAISSDSDITVWIGTKNDPFNNHLTLSDALLATMVKEDDDIDHYQPRWAAFNGDGISGNVLVIAASSSDTTPDDAFKIRKVAFGCVPPPPPCVDITVSLAGTSKTTGSAGNIRTFSSGGVSVKASAFSRANSTGAWATAYLGSYSHGLGVTDGGESGANDTHTVDNIGSRNNYVLFEFAQPVTVTQAFLDYVGADSDISVWIGTKNDPFNNHLTLSDALLASLAGQASDTTSGDARWAAFNGGAMSGNVLVIAASKSDTTPDDSFKLSKLKLACK